MDPDKIDAIREEQATHVKEIHVEKEVLKVGKFIKKIFKPLLLLIIIGAIFYAGYWIKSCPVCEECEVCEVCIDCPDLDCSTCPKEVEQVTTIRYACASGIIVDDLSECNPLNFVKIESPYKETNNAVTLAIDKVEFETVGTYSKITKIDYTILNMREHEIKPIIAVNIYSKDGLKSESGLVHEIFDDDEYIASNSWVIKKKETNIGFADQNMVIRLVMKDTLTDPDMELVRVSRDLDI